MMTLSGSMEFTSGKEQGRKGEGVEDIAHIYRPSEMAIIRSLG